jgi:hypothetical protein
LEEKRDSDDEDEEEEEDGEDGYTERSIFDRLMGRTLDLPPNKLVEDLSTSGQPAVMSKNSDTETDDDTEDTEDESTRDTSDSSTEDMESDTDPDSDSSDSAEEINSAAPHPSGRPRPKAQDAK